MENNQKLKAFLIEPNLSQIYDQLVKSGVSITDSDFNSITFYVGDLTDCACGNYRISFIEMSSNFFNLEIMNQLKNYKYPYSLFNYLMIDEEEIVFSIYAKEYDEPVLWIPR